MNTNRLKRLILCSYIGLVFTTLVILPDKLEEPITYTEIGDNIIKAQGIFPGIPLHDNVDGNGIPQLHKQEQRRIIFSLLDSIDHHRTSDNNRHINLARRHMIRDLEIFADNKNGTAEKSLFTAINFTQTIWGEAVLAKKMLEPLTDIKTLQDRQAFIRELVHNEELRIQLETLVANIKKVEPALLSFWVKDESQVRREIKKLFFDSLDHFNNDPKMLQLNMVYRYIKTVGPAVYDVALMSFFEFIHRYMSNHKDLSISGSLWRGIKDVCWPSEDIEALGTLYNGWQSVVPWEKAGVENKEAFKELLKKHYIKHERALQEDSLLDFNDANINSNLNKAYTGIGIRILCKAIFLGLKGWSIKRALDEGKAVSELVKRMHTKLTQVACLVDELRNLNQLLLQNPVIALGLLSSGNLNKLCSNVTRDDEFLTLLSLLKSPIFKGKNYRFSYAGHVLATYYGMANNKEQFAMLLETLGELDACLSIAQLYRKFQHARVHYCFVTYEESKKPHIRLEHFWNPQVDPAIVVPNDIELGGPQVMQNMILTGSNTGGKSTLLKAVMIDLLLGQSFGIAPGSTIIITPFTYLGTSMNVIDAIGDGKSSYQAEVDRAASLIFASREMDAREQLSFLAIDELFRGTGHEIADEETYNCAQYLNSMSTLSYILATHFTNKPITLEQATNGMCQNYKIEVNRNDDGTLIRTFTLKKGINTSHVGGDILEYALKSRLG